MVLGRMVCDCEVLVQDEAADEQETHRQQEAAQVVEAAGRAGQTVQVLASPKCDEYWSLMSYFACLIV